MSEEFTVHLADGPSAGQWSVSEDDGWAWPLPERLPWEGGAYARAQEFDGREGHSGERGAVYRFEVQRCPHDLVLTECALCAPRPAHTEAGDSDQSWQGLSQAAREGSMGPWISAGYSGECAGCGERFEVGDRIRASDALGDWVAEECGCGNAS